MLRTRTNIKKHAKIPLIPLVVTPDGEGVQDSTPIIERVEGVVSVAVDPSPDPVAAFVSALLEEFGDEWGNKWMFHYRWARDVDQISSAGRIARQWRRAPTRASTPKRPRRSARGWSTASGSSVPTRRPRRRSKRHSRRAIDLLETHLADGPICSARVRRSRDFGIWGQLYCAWTDPTAGALIEGRAPSLLAWIQRMLWPRADGEFEAFSSLSATLMPLLETSVGRLFLPWSVANAGAIAAGAESFTVELDGREWTQKPQKYHARSLARAARKICGDARQARARRGARSAPAVSWG